MSKLVLKPATIVLGMVGGIVAGRLFKQVWRRLSGEDEPPQATSDDYTWTEVLAAAAIHGAILATVKAAIDRGSAKGVRRVTRKRPVEAS